MICCGKNRTTRFCPECGKKLKDPDSLSGLLAYIQGEADKHLKRAGTLRANRDNGAVAAAHNEKIASGADRVAARYDRWAKLLRETLPARHLLPLVDVIRLTIIADALRRYHDEAVNVEKVAMEVQGMPYTLADILEAYEATLAIQSELSPSAD